MKMLNCPKCSLTIPESQEECPKCHTKVGRMTLEIEEEMIETVGKETSEVENLCNTCMALVKEGDDFCQLCSFTIEASPEIETPASHVPKTDEEANKWMAAIGYVAFFLPVLFGYHRRSKFVSYHTKQAVLLFIASTILFLGLVMLRNRIDELFTTSLIPNFNGRSLGLVPADNSWRHGTGILFHYYLTGMLYALHLIPFALMLTGIINSIEGKKKPLPLIARFLKLEAAKKNIQ